MSTYQINQNFEAHCSVDDNPSSIRTACAFNGLTAMQQTFTKRLKAEFKEDLVIVTEEIDSRFNNLVIIVNIAFE
jgi:hypothetical protein